MKLESESKAKRQQSKSPIGWSKKKVMINSSFAKHITQNMPQPLLTTQSATVNFQKGPVIESSKIEQESADNALNVSQFSHSQEVVLQHQYHEYMRQCKL